MKAWPVWCLGLLAACSSPAASHGLAIVEVRPADGELQAQLAARYADAQARHLHPFVQVYADWCGPCKALRKEMDDPRMQAAFDGVYLVRVELDPWKAGIMQLLGGDAPDVPVFYEVKSDGALGRSVDGRAWGADTAENIAPVMSAYFQGQPLPEAPAAPTVTQGAVGVQKVMVPTPAPVPAAP